MVTGARTVFIKQLIKEAFIIEIARWAVYLFAYVKIKHSQRKQTCNR